MDDLDGCKRELRRRMKAARAGLAEGERAQADAEICTRVCESEPFRTARVIYTYLAFGSEVETRGIIERAFAAGKTVALPRCAGPHELRWYRVDDLDGLEPGAFGILEPPADPAREIVPPDEDFTGASVTSTPLPEGCVPDAPPAQSIGSCCACASGALLDLGARHHAGISGSGCAASRVRVAGAPAPGNRPAPDPRVLALVPGLAFDATGARLGYGGGYYDAFLTTFPGTSLGLCYACQLVGSLGALGVIAPHDRFVNGVIVA